MKKVYGLTISLLIFASPILSTLAEGSSWNRSQARMRKAARAESIKIADFWKKFDTEINQADAVMSDPAKISQKLNRKKDRQD